MVKRKQKINESRFSGDYRFIVYFAKRDPRLFEAWYDANASMLLTENTAQGGVRGWLLAGLMMAALAAGFSGNKIWDFVNGKLAEKGQPPTSAKEVEGNSGVQTNPNAQGQQGQQAPNTQAPNTQAPNTQAPPIDGAGHAQAGAQQAPNAQTAPPPAKNFTPNWQHLQQPGTSGVTPNAMQQHIQQQRQAAQQQP